MNFGGIISLVLGILIIIKFLFEIPFGFSVFLLSILSVLLIVDGFKVFKEIKGYHIGNLIFGFILFTELIGLIELSKMDFFFSLFGSYLSGYGLAAIILKLPFLLSKNLTVDEETLFSFDSERIDMYLNFDWTDFKMSNFKEKNKVKIKKNYDRSLFKEYLNKTDESFELREKLRINTSNIPEMAKIEIELDQDKKYKASIQFNASKCTLDLRNLNIELLEINSLATQLTIILSKRSDVFININARFSNLNIILPEKVGAVINVIGELNWREFGDLVKKGDQFVTRDIIKSNYISHINLSSEISKISVYSEKKAPI